MKLTDEQIELLKENPIAQLLFSLFDTVESEQPMKEDIPEEKVVVKSIQSKPKFSISKEDYEFLSKAAIEFNKNLMASRKIGLDVNIKDLTLVGSLFNIVYTLLRLYISPDFANKFANGLITDRLAPDYFTNLYNDQNRNN